MKPHVFVASAMFLLAEAGALFLTSAATQASGPSGMQPTVAPYLGGLVNPPLPKPNFTLTDTTGAPFDFWAKTHGYVTLLFFGYTHCPAECPLHVQNVALGLGQLPMDVRKQVKLVFVTTDAPTR